MSKKTNELPGPHDGDDAWADAAGRAPIMGLLDLMTSPKKCPSDVCSLIGGSHDASSRLGREPKSEGGFLTSRSGPVLIGLLATAGFFLG
jgi:hypothetical protein